MGENKDIEILEANKSEQKKYGLGCGSDTIVLSDEHIQALQAGKMLAWNNGEYSTFVILASKPKEHKHSFVESKLKLET